MSDFATFTALRHVTEGRFAIDVPDGWQQGRGAFGGFGLGCLARAIETAENVEERPTRSITAELCGPLLPGPADIAVEVLRRGAGMTTVAARIVQDGAIVAHAVAILGRSRDDRPYEGLPRPERLSSFADVAPLREKGPPFTQFFEYRITGPMPLSGQSTALTETWVRHRIPGPRVDTAHVVALADATWPSLFTTLTEPRVFGTVSFMLQLFGPWNDLSPDAPLYHRARTLWARDGHVAEVRELWTEDGRLVSINQQTFAIIR